MADETFVPSSDLLSSSPASCGKVGSSKECQSSTIEKVDEASSETSGSSETSKFHFPLGKPGPFQIIESGSFSCSPCKTPASCREKLRCVDQSESTSQESYNIPHVELRTPHEPPRRRYSCPNYNTCLDLAAALNWDSFTCRGCSGEVDEALLWRARQALKRDEIARSVCELPEIQLHSTGTSANSPGGLKLVSKG